QGEQALLALSAGRDRRRRRHGRGRGPDRLRRPARRGEADPLGHRRAHGPAVRHLEPDRPGRRRDRPHHARRSRVPHVVAAPPYPLHLPAPRTADPARSTAPRTAVARDHRPGPRRRRRLVHPVLRHPARGVPARRPAARRPRPAHHEGPRMSARRAGTSPTNPLENTMTRTRTRLLAGLGALTLTAALAACSTGTTDAGD